MRGVKSHSASKRRLFDSFIFPENITISNPFCCQFSRCFGSIFVSHGYALGSAEGEREAYLVLIPLRAASRLYGRKITQKNGKGKEKRVKKNIEYPTRNIEHRREVNGNIEYPTRNDEYRRGCLYRLYSLIFL